MDEINKVSKEIELGIELYLNLCKRASIYDKENKFELAIRDYTRAIEVNSNLDKAYNNRGAIYIQIQEFELAIEDFNKVIEIDPNSYSGYNNRSLIFNITKQYDLEIMDLSKLIEFDENDYENYLARGIAYEKIYNYESALLDFSKAIDLNPNSDYAFYRCGMIYGKIDEFDLAIENFTESIRLNPTSLGYNNLGNMYLKLKKYLLAIENYSEAVNCDEFLIESYRGRSTSYFLIKKYKYCVKDISKIIELKEGTYQDYSNRANANYELRKYQEVIIDATRAIQLDPFQYVAYDVRGRGYFSLKKYSLAIEDFTRSIEIDSSISISYHARLNCYVAINEMHKAGKDLNKYLYRARNEEKIFLNRNVLELFVDTPYNYVFFIENFDVDFTKTHLIGKNIIDKIDGIETYFGYLEKQESSIRKNISNRAIINIYMGSPVASFIIYDEILNLDYSPLRSQELFYYVLSSTQIDIDRDDLFSEVIHNILSQDSKDDIDFYYLGQIYLIKNKTSKAIECFRNSIKYTPSLIMLLSLEKDKNVQLILFQTLKSRKNREVNFLLNGMKKSELLIDKSFDNQFQDYFLIRELMPAVEYLRDNFSHQYKFNTYSYFEIWETFILSKSEKESIELSLRKKEIQRILNQIIIEYEKSLIITDPKEKKVYLNKLKISLMENQNLDVALLFEYLIQKKHQGNDIEKQLGLVIEDFRIAKPKLYIYLISYFYLLDSIDAKQSFSLFTYLIEITRRESNKDLLKILQLLITPDDGKLFLISLGLSPYLMRVVNFAEAFKILFDSSKDFELQNKSDYVSYMENLWQFISYEKETSSKENFLKKFQLFPQLTNECYEL